MSTQIISKKHYYSELNLIVFLLLIGFPLFLCMIGTLLNHLPEPIGSRSDLFFEGSKQTIFLSIFAGLLGFIFGVILALAKLSQSLYVRMPGLFFIWFLRGTPLLIQILFVYYALPLLIPSLKFGDFTAAIIALALNVGAYNAEVVRSAILAIPGGQIEAAKSLNFSKFQTMRFIIFPQAFKIMLPAITNNFSALIKDSSLASSIGLLELSLAGNRVSSETFLPLPVLATVALVYLCFTSFVNLIMYLLEKKNQNYG